jgi:hypothetical protein
MRSKPVHPIITPLQEEEEEEEEEEQHHHHHHQHGCAGAEPVQAESESESDDEIDSFADISIPSEYLPSPVDDSIENENEDESITDRRSDSIYAHAKNTPRDSDAGFSSVYVSEEEEEEEEGEEEDFEDTYNNF